MWLSKEVLYTRPFWVCFIPTFQVASGFLLCVQGLFLSDRTVHVFGGPAYGFLLFTTFRYCSSAFYSNGV